jgi:DNA-binding transcriptional LysR family regulator
MRIRDAPRRRCGSVFFAAPAIGAFSQKNPNIHLHMKSVINLNNVRDNQTDMMLAFAPDSHAGVVVKRLGSVHFHPTVFARLCRKTACPRKNNIAQHKFLQSQFYETEVWADWLALVARGRISHYCETLSPTE